MATEVRPYIESGDPTCPTREMGPEYCLYPTALPINSVKTWVDGTDYSLGVNIDYAGRSYVCISSHTADSTNRPDLSSNPDGTNQRWAVVGGGVQRIAGNTGTISPLNRIGWGEIEFLVDASASHSSTSFHVESPSGSPLNDARVTLQLPITEAGGFDTAGEGLDNTGSTVFLDPVVRNDILLVNGFFLTAGTTVGTRTPYTGQIAGYDSATYWFDTSDSSWYDAETGGTRLIGF